MKSQTFDTVELISMLGFLNYFKLACHTSGMHEGSVMCLLHLFIKKSTGAFLNGCTGLKPRKKRHQDGGITTYCEVVNYLLSTKAIDDFIAKAVAEMTTSRQPLNMNSMEYSQFLWRKRLTRGSVYDDSGLKGTFIEAVHGSIRHSMPANWGSHKTSTLQEFARTPRPMKASSPYLYQQRPPRP